MAFLWAACSGNNNNESENALQQETQISLENVSVFECKEDFTFTALTAADSVRLFLPDTSSFVLPQTVAASGARYESDDGDILFWNKGNEALLEFDGKSFQNCVYNARESVWERARLSGVTFRALGQEPGWIMDITDKQITLAYNYGQDTVQVSIPQTDYSRNDSTTTYRAKTTNHTLHIEITDEQCSDAMSGFSFPATVVVTLDSDTLKGCGRPLGK